MRQPPISLPPSLPPLFILVFLFSLLSFLHAPSLLHAPHVHSGPGLVPHPGASKLSQPPPCPLRALRQAGKKDPPPEPPDPDEPPEACLSPHTPRPGCEGVKNTGQTKPAPSPQAGPPLGLAVFLFLLLSPFFFLKKHMSLAITHALILIMTRCLMACNKTTTNLACSQISPPRPHPAASSPAPALPQQSFTARPTQGKGRKAGVNSVICSLFLRSRFHSWLIPHSRTFY